MKPRRRDTLRRRIREAGLRATESRILVLDHLDAVGRPVTHSEVADALDGSGMDRATVYRNLTDLADAGVARRSDFGDHVWRFELEARHDRGRSPVHFVCKACGIVECLPNDAVVVQLRRGVPAREIEINITGTCDQCA